MSIIVMGGAHLTAATDDETTEQGYDSYGWGTFLSSAADDDTTEQGYNNDGRGTFNH